MLGVQLQQRFQRKRPCIGLPAKARYDKGHHSRSHEPR
jgi:hypothetical protein